MLYWLTNHRFLWPAFRFQVTFPAQYTREGSLFKQYILPISSDGG